MNRMDDRRNSFLTGSIGDRALRRKTAAPQPTDRPGEWRRSGGTATDTGRTLVRKLTCSIASAAFALALSNAALAQSHGSGSHGGGSQHETTGGEHESGGCSGNCEGDEQGPTGGKHDDTGCNGGSCGGEHDAGGGDNGDSGKGRMSRGGGIIRGHPGGADRGDLHDIFEQMEGDTAGPNVTGGAGEEGPSHGADTGE